MDDKESALRPRPLFVIGLFRSGTTLIYALLNQHSAISLMYEADVMAVPGLSADAAAWPRWAKRAEFWNRVFTRHRITREECVHSKSLRELYANFARRKRAKFFGEKSPGYSRWLKKVARDFPEARFIIVLRELPEIYQSVRDAAAGGSRFFRRRGQLPRLIYSHRKLMRDAAGLRAQSIPLLEIRYREVVSDARAVSDRVCTFLGLEPEPAMASLAGADLSAIHRAPHHEQVRKGKIERRLEARAEIPEAGKKNLRMFAQASGQSPFTPEESLRPLSPRHKITRFGLLGLGWGLSRWDDAKRLLYYYLPIHLLRGYRRMRNLSDDSDLIISEKPSFRKSG